MDTHNTSQRTVEEGLLFNLLTSWEGSHIQKACLGLNQAATAYEMCNACLLSQATNPSVCAQIHPAPSTSYTFPQTWAHGKFKSYREISVLKADGNFKQPGVVYFCGFFIMCKESYTPDANLDKRETAFF